MSLHRARVRGLRLEANGQISAFISCPSSAVPAPGRYVQAYSPDLPVDSGLAHALFQGGMMADPLQAEFTSGSGELTGFWAAPPIPTRWRPGTLLRMRGPLGHGFTLPAEIQRLALVALNDNTRRLLPLLDQVSEGCAIALFCDSPLPEDLPPAAEAYPLNAISVALGWADFLAVDVSLEGVEKLPSLLGFSSHEAFPIPGQALVEIAMPCAGLASCGVCAIPTRKGEKIVCHDGPVFDLQLLIR